MSRTQGIAELFFSRVHAPAQWLALFDHLPEVYLFVKDDQHRFVAVNRALATLHGCASASDMLGKTDWDYHPPTLAAQYVDEDRRVMAAARPLPDQVWLVPGADRQPRWYVCTKVPVRGRDERVIGIAGVMRPYEHAGQAPGDYRRLTPAIEYVLRRYADPISVATLARKVHLSISQFQRDFRRLFGVSPTQYMLEVRVRMARQMLEATGEPLSTIAAECGFYDQSHFVRRFKQVTGMRPLEYRRRFQIRQR